MNLIGEYVRYMNDSQIVRSTFAKIGVAFR